jgi:hypothetical protein
MAKGQPFSVRLQEDTERVVEAEAKRTRRTKSAVVEAFTEETARTRRFPGIAFRGDDARRLEDFGSPEALVKDTTLSPTHVRLAVAYRDAYPDEINDAVAENRRPLADIDVLYPFLSVSDG